MDYEFSDEFSQVLKLQTLVEWINERARREAVDALLEEEAKLADDVNARAAKAAKTADSKAKEAHVERLVPHIKLASAAAGRRKLSLSDQCVDDIRPHLPKEEQGATFEVIKAAIRAAKDRG